MNKSESIKELATALAKAQGEIENAKKTETNTFFKKPDGKMAMYADLAECLNTVRPIFSKHGLSLSQFPSFENGVASVESILMHSSGDWISSTASAPVSKPDAQGVGSATTYLRRYSIAAIAGIAQEDDDANSAVGHKASPVQNGSAMDTAKIEFEKLPFEAREAMKSVAEELAHLFNTVSIESAYDKLEEQQYTNESKLAIWHLLDSKLRTAIKKETAKRKA